VGFLFARPRLISVPFFLAGSLKIIYDILLYKEFVGLLASKSIPIDALQ